MLIDPIRQTWQIDGNTLKITSEDGRNLASVLLNPSFIKARLPQPTGKVAECPAPSLVAERWALINVKVSGPAVAKAYLISLSRLQSVINQEEEVRGQNVIQAAKSGRKESVTTLLASGSISQVDRGIAVWHAAGNGHVGIVSSLLANGSISIGHRDGAVASAARGGHTEIVSSLLANGSISEFYRGQAVRAAAGGGHVGIVSSLLANGSISKEYRGQAVADAARGGHTGIVISLLSNGPIPEVDRGQAALAAAEHGNSRSLTSLLASGSISEFYRGLAIRTAFESECTDPVILQIVTSLLANGSISDVDRGEAVRDAANAGHEGIVTLLLASGSISEKHRGLAACAASHQGYAGIITSLIENGSIPEMYRAAAVLGAARSGHAEIVTSLIENGSIPEMYRGMAAQAAARGGHAGIVISLLANGSISEMHRSRAVEEASEGGYAGIVTSLLASGSISEDYRGKAVRAAAKDIHVEIVTSLLASGSISERDRDFAVIDAAKGGHNGIVTSLLASGSISADARGLAIRTAFESECTDPVILQIVTSLLASGSISAEDRGLATLHAAQRGYASFVISLLASGPISNELRGLAVRAAAERGFGYAPLVTSLLASGSISDADRGLAVRVAAHRGNSEIVTALLASGSISEEDRGLAIQAAVDRLYSNIAILRIVTLLLASGSISVVLRSTAIQIAHIHGHAGIVALLGGPPVAAPPALAGRLYIHPEEITKHPELYLANTAENGLKPVTFLMPDGSEQPGIDAGGLTKQFLCQLAEHLILKEVIETDDLRFPRSSKGNLSPYIQLGKLLSHIDRVNATRRDSLFIGEIFHPQTYALLQILARPENLSESSRAKKEREFVAIANAIATPATQSLVNFLNNKAPSDADIAAIKATLAEAGQGPLEELVAPALRAMCFECLGVESTHDPLSAILEGLSPALKGKILAEGGSIASKLQGEINERLLGKFVCLSQNPVVNQKLAWLKEKIQLELADPSKSWIKRFLKCVTSQSVLPVGNIEITVSSDAMCRAHTCFNRLDVPVTYETGPLGLSPKDRFIKNLEVTMADEGFGLA